VATGANIHCRAAPSKATPLPVWLFYACQLAVLLRAAIDAIAALPTPPFTARDASRGEARWNASWSSLPICLAVHWQDYWLSEGDGARVSVAGNVNG
jgi:hypothetical protein